MHSEVESTNHPNAQAIRRVRALSHLLDNSISIPGTNFRFGIDPILGLIPGAGDVAGTALSAYIVIEAARFGVPREVLMRMVGNILFDTIAGSVPVLGDLVDLTWKSNRRNVALLESHLNIPSVASSPSNRKAGWGLIIGLGIGFMLLAIVLTAISVVLIRLLFKALNW